MPAFHSETNSTWIPALAIYAGGTAQKAVTILHRMNWLQPVHYAEPKETTSSTPRMRLSFSVGTSLKLCSAFLQTVGIQEDDANSLVAVIKQDAVVRFSRKVSVIAIEQPGYCYTSQDKVEYHIVTRPPALNTTGNSGLDWTKIQTVT